MEERKIKDKNNFKEDIDKETDIYYYILSRDDIVKYIYDEEKDMFVLREDEEDRRTLTTIIQTSLKEKLGKENVEKIIKEMKESEVTMLGSLSRIIDNERAIGIQEGIRQERVKMKQNLRKMVKEMKKNNLPIELIEKITGLTKQEIHNIN